MHLPQSVSQRVIHAPHIVLIIAATAIFIAVQLQ